MLQILQKQEPANFARIITGDEFWFFLASFRNRVWRQGEENTPERVSPKINTEKHIFTIFWSRLELIFEEWSPKHDTFHIIYFCEGIIPRVTIAVFSDQGRRRK
jgi:hypothetical protein